MTTKLKPCKCSIRYSIRVHGDKNYGFFVICEDCKTSTDLYSTESEAIDAWNRRAGRH